MDWVLKLLQGVGAVFAAFVTIWGAVSSQPLVVAGGLAVLVLFGVLIYIFRRDRSRPGARSEELESPQIRGLIPFNKGNTLLGRDTDIEKVLTRILDTSYRFGYLTGEAGVGKSSLIRAGLLGQLEKQGLRAVYVERSGATPARAAAAKLGAAAGSPSSKLAALLANELSSSDVTTIFLIFDQFEEFLISAEPQAARTEMRLLSDLVQRNWDGGKQVRILLSLRKDYTDDLVSVAEKANAPTLTRFRLHRWTKAQFADYLASQEVSQQSGYSDALRGRLAHDLNRNAGVLPAEFQLIASAMLSSHVGTEDAYNARGGAEVFAAEFLRDALNRDAPNDNSGKSDSHDLDARTGELLLVALCREDGQSRADAQPLDSLRRLTVAQVRQERPLVAKTAAAAAFDRICGILADRRIVEVSNDEVSLSHDYLVAPIIRLSGGRPVASDRPSMILRNLIARQKDDRRFTISLWDLIVEIPRASAALRLEPEAKELIDRSIRFQAVVVLAFVALMTLITIPMGLTGFHTRISASWSIEPSEWIGNDAAVARIFGNQLEVLETGTDWQKRKLVSSSNHPVAYNGAPGVQFSTDGRWAIYPSDGAWILTDVTGETPPEVLAPRDPTNILFPLFVSGGKRTIAFTKPNEVEVRSLDGSTTRFSIKLEENRFFSFPWGQGDRDVILAQDLPQFRRLPNEMPALLSDAPARALAFRTDVSSEPHRYGHEWIIGAPIPGLKYVQAFKPVPPPYTPDTKPSPIYWFDFTVLPPATEPCAIPTDPFSPRVVVEGPMALDDDTLLFKIDNDLWEVRPCISPTPLKVIELPPPAVQTEFSFTAVLGRVADRDQWVLSASGGLALLGRETSDHVRLLCMLPGTEFGPPGPRWLIPSPKGASHLVFGRATEIWVKSTSCAADARRVADVGRPLLATANGSVLFYTKGADLYRWESGQSDLIGQVDSLVQRMLTDDSGTTALALGPTSVARVESGFFLWGIRLWPLPLGPADQPPDFVDLSVPQY